MYADDPNSIYEIIGNNKYQVVYDRLYDRKFDNLKFLQAVGKCEFESPEIGLEKCLKEFLEKPKFKGTPGFAMMDKLAGQRTKLREIPDLKQKCKYLAVRYLPHRVVALIRYIVKSS